MCVCVFMSVGYYTLIKIVHYLHTLCQVSYSALFRRIGYSLHLPEGHSPVVSGCVPVRKCLQVWEETGVLVKFCRSVNKARAG